MKLTTATAVQLKKAEKRIPEKRKKEMIEFRKGLSISNAIRRMRS